MPLDLTRQIVARWSDPDPRHVELLRQAKVEAVLLEQPSEAFERASAAAGIVTAPASAAAGVHSKGLWPGIRGGPNVRGQGDETASASREPWIDANGYLVAYHRAVHQESVPILGYRPDDEAGLSSDRVVPFTTLEVALAEARSGGGNYVLTLESRYRTALLAGEARALAAWKRLGETAAWLRGNATLFGRTVMPAITMLVEEGEATAELANLAFRRNTCPALAPAADPPTPQPERILCLSAASIRPPGAPVAARILAHALAGATVVVDHPGEKAWWRDRRLKHLKDEGDRDVFQCGKGRLIAYRETIADPSEFALDLIDFVTHPKRAVRLWNASTVIPLPTAGRGPREALVHLINYGQPLDRELQARVCGHYSKATLLRPGGAPIELKTARRGSTTEVFVPELGCTATIVFG